MKKGAETNCQSGFTLLEVVIAVAIMAVLSFYTAQSISTAVRTKAKVQSDIDRVALVRAAMNIMKEDIHRAFNYRDPNIELYNRAGAIRQAKQQQQQQAGNTGQATGAAGGDPDNANPASGATGAAGAAGAPLPPFQPRPEVIFTAFRGEKDKLYFTSLNNARTQSNESSSEQMKVGYFLRNCKSRKDLSKSSQCLVRTKATYLDDQVDKGGEEMVLLEDVTRFELQYLGPIRGADWQGNWKSNDGQDASMRGQFPVAVEITIEHQDKSLPNSKPTAMTVVAEIRNPNNPQDLPPDEQQAQGALQQQFQQQQFQQQQGPPGGLGGRRTF